MKVDELMTMLEECHHEAEVLLCIGNQTFDLRKLAHIKGTSRSYHETEYLIEKAREWLNDRNHSPLHSFN